MQQVTARFVTLLVTVGRRHDIAVTIGRSHDTVAARALSSLVPSERLLCHVRNDGLAFILGRADLALSGALNQKIQLAIILWNLLPFVIETAADCDGSSCELVDLGNGFPMGDLRSSQTCVVFQWSVSSCVG